MEKESDIYKLYVALLQTGNCNEYLCLYLMCVVYSMCSCLLQIPPPGGPPPAFMPPLGGPPLGPMQGNQDLNKCVVPFLPLTFYSCNTA